MDGCKGFGKEQTARRKGGDPGDLLERLIPFSSFCPWPMAAPCLRALSQDCPNGVL